MAAKSSGGKSTPKPAAKPKAAAKKTETISGGSGQKPITFKKGGLHESTGTPANKPIPAATMQQALSGKLGPKAQKQANFAKNVLGGAPKTAAKNAKKGS